MSCVCACVCVCALLCESRLLSSGGFWTVCDPEQKPQFDVNDVCSQPLHTSSELAAVLSNTSGTDGRVRGTTSHLPGATLRFYAAHQNGIFHLSAAFWRKRGRKIQGKPPYHLHLSLPLCAHSHKGQSTGVGYRSAPRDNIQHSADSKHLGWRKNIN